MDVWTVRAIAPYRRELKGKEGPKRERTYVPNGWESDLALGGINVPVVAKTAEEAEQKALDDERVERLRGPTTRMETVK